MINYAVMINQGPDGWSWATWCGQQHCELSQAPATDLMTARAQALRTIPRNTLFNYWLKGQFVGTQRSRRI